MFHFKLTLTPEGLSYDPWFLKCLQFDNYDTNNFHKNNQSKCKDYFVIKMYTNFINI